MAQKFKYNGVELEESLGLNLYEMDLRMYDLAIARFNRIDPIVHFSQGTSVAFDNNPVFWSDPSGADTVNQNGFVTSDSGVISWGHSSSSQFDCDKGDCDDDTDEVEDDADNSNFGTWIIAKVKSIFGMAGNEINKLHQSGNSVVADEINQDNKKSKKEAAKVLGTIYTTATLGDPFAAANLTRFLAASNSDLSYSDYYSSFNSVFGTDYGALSDGIFGFVGLSTLGMGSTGLQSGYTSQIAYWSGPGSRGLASSRAFLTLDKTLGGRILNYVDSGLNALGFKYAPNTLRYNLWARLSAYHARNASGTVHVFQNAEKGVGIQSIFAKYEYPALLNNPNVRNIIFHY